MQVIQALSNELREAVRIAPIDDPVLRLKDCSIELGITWERSGKAEISFYVFKLGGDVNKTNTQTITLNLEPLQEIMAMPA